MVSIIGAGPAGNYLAYLLAQKGINVDVYEEHPAIGRPIQCTGIMTAYLNQLLDLSEAHEFVVNEITGTRVFAPNGTSVFIPLKKNLIVDRAFFDTYLGKLAASAGARFHYNSRFKSARVVDNKHVITFLNGNQTVETEALVGADGPGSLVAKNFGIYGNRQFVIGVQARVKLHAPIDPSIVDFYVDKKEPGYIGWSVPETSTISRIGVASYAHSKHHFDELLARLHGTIIEWQSGVIPLYNPHLNSALSSVFLLGDAATMVKATTYGGIIPALQAAHSLAHVLAHQGTALEYEAAWKKTIGTQLWLHLALRRYMDTFSIADYNALIQYATQDHIRNLLTTYDREYPSKLLFRALLREPRFLRFLFSPLTPS